MQTVTDKIRSATVHGRSHGFGTRVPPDIDALVEPTGWVWSDPYTNCTYCPECWAQIKRGEAAE